ncbi:acyltransferase family protein [Bradyrhizobium diazoefficiens]|uniref:Acyltransferase n=1 Tax=Bradyrhizobium diazoefficiens TaxID=1355477 RepID=A0A810CWQ6_9BRAD|nr:acyltransferase [Bradyrhizobium diazoefficiens]WLA70016.1 acyltransferase [Bradyrhizobium diazoefficiens]BCE22384.1 acyltransferase [Bradyrhizobium diazoefficiens]BCE48648.1 acyltransferase [Bradyrhizobium diazoefficiens]BCE92164.1 acyltransferase [Bradyrhizobium diazoefficiens]BCF27091.1 acyltransferase [Bradyrhizobium diazoefficiens]
MALLETNRFDGIQIGRAVAALSVLYFHSWTALVRFPDAAAYPIWPLSRFGQLGVDLFFGISGFVICLIASKRDFQPITFLARRAIRIYPLWLLCLGTLAALFAIWRGWQNSETLGYLLYSATLLPTQALPFYNVGWTLQHEMAFYVLAAVIVPWCGLRGLLGFLVASSFVLTDAPWFISKLAAFHIEFAAGIFAYLLLPKLRWAGSLLPISAGLVGMCVAFQFADRQFIALPLFVAIVGFANLSTHGAIGRQLVTMGDRSYSIYLLHLLIFWVCSSVTSLFASKIPLWSVEPIRFGCIGAVIVLAGLTWKYIERPTINLGNALLARPTRLTSTVAPAAR